MTECYRCGIPEERERLFDAISNKGVVKICRSCADEESLPLIQPMDLNKPEKTKTVYERLSRMANLDPEKHKRSLVEMERQENIRFGKARTERRQETNLKGIVDSNFEKNKPKPRTDLVDNFHWVIMRARRSKKLTQKQLAENIGESEAIVKNAEEGIVLNNADTFVRKLESYFGIKLRKGESPYSTEGPKFVHAGEDPAKREIRERFEKENKFDSATNEALSIADLQEIKKKKEAENPKGFFSFLKRNKKEEEPQKEDKEMSDEEVEDILFRK
jgi:ribosome-binding protein aMBF1 (putative translation factor)